jgi:myo-inositol-1(or 4)-monophosphatase
MLTEDIKPTLAEISGLARKAGQLLLTRYGKPHDIQMKGVVDLVTEADHLAENLILSSLKRRFPTHQVISEEVGSNNLESEHVWYIDPLDGTINFAHGIPLFSVSIAYSNQGKVELGVVYEPVHDECFSAEQGKGAWLNGKPIHVSNTTSLLQSLLVTGYPNEKNAIFNKNLNFDAILSSCTRGVRRLGSAALDMCYVATGRVDGFWELTINPWDFAAGCLIASEAGAFVTNCRGSSVEYVDGESVLAAAPHLHGEILSVLLQDD